MLCFFISTYWVHSPRPLSTDFKLIHGGYADSSLPRYYTELSDVSRVMRLLKSIFCESPPLKTIRKWLSINDVIVHASYSVPERTRRSLAAAVDAQRRGHGWET